jgi:hypothetical protein
LEQHETAAKIYICALETKNGKVERQFQTIFGKIRRVFHAMRLMDEVKNGVWVECMMTNVLIKHYFHKMEIKRSNISSFCANPSHDLFLKVFDEIG